VCRLSDFLVGKSKVDSKRLLEVSARLGDAAADPALWPEVMQQISTAIRATGAVLLQSNVRTPDVPRTAGVEEMVTHYFAAGWNMRDLRAERGVPLLARGVKVISDQNVVTPDEMRCSPYYAEVVAPFGFQWFAAIGFAAGPDPWVLVIQRTPEEGAFERDDKRALASLAQRLTEVATTSTLVGRTALSGMSNALGLVNRPALAVDRLGFVLDINAPAEALFDDDIRVTNRRLWVRDQKARRALDTFIDQLRARPDTAVLPAAPIVVQRQAKRPLLVRILPIDGAARSPFLGARALLVLSDFSKKRVVPADLLGAAFGLSPAEAKLTAIIAKGYSLDEAAEQLSIARETARNQLKAVFAKTNTHRQSELVALLSRI
jgi:DNA-binding CsgD family transcriptional regulator